MEEWRNGVLEEWSIGVLGYWSIGMFTIPAIHHSTTPPLHHSIPPFSQRLYHLCSKFGHVFDKGVTISSSGQETKSFLTFRS